MERKCQSQDRGIAETQNLLATAMIPIINLAETFKTQFSSNPAARTLLSDALTLVGQAQFHLSVRRCYMIRAVLKKKFHSLCNISTLITTQLFGDDVLKRYEVLEFTCIYWKRAVSKRKIWIYL